MKPYLAQSPIERSYHSYMATIGLLLCDLFYQVGKIDMSKRWLSFADRHLPSVDEIIASSTRVDVKSEEVE